MLSQTSSKQYEVRSISVSEEDKGLASLLLTHLTQDADSNKIELYFNLLIGTANIDKSRHLLEKFRFTLYASEEDVEVWIRSPR